MAVRLYGFSRHLVVTRQKSGLWTDGRYYIQAEKQLEGTGIELYKTGMPGVPDYIEWLKEELPENSCVGICGEVFSVSKVREMEKELSKKGISLNKEFDLVDEIWEGRPPVPQQPVFIHDVAFAGRTAAQKLYTVRQEMAKKGVNYYLVCSLDDVAWLYNIRGSDIAYNPVAIAYALVSSNQAWLFIDSNKVPGDVACMLHEKE